VGRRHLIRFAALVAVLVCVPAAAAGTHVSTWLLQGTTEPNGTQTLHAYFASRRSDLGPWVRRLTAAHQARVRRVDFDRTVLFAGFLDGQTCAFDVRLTSWTYVRRRLIVNVAFRKPPVGTATCVRTSVSYLVIGFNRAELGVLPTFVQMRTLARA
jgi:hypothetical protein